jgi:hypothetical protein
MKSNDPYEYNIRLKPFLLSYSRNVMAEIIYNNRPEKVVRVFCDAITYNEEVKINNTSMIKEEKSTGLYYFHNAYTIIKLCKICCKSISRSDDLCDFCLKKTF